MSQVSCGLHWYTFTAGRDHDRVMDALGGGFSQVEKRGGFGHPMRYVHESGAEVYCGSDREDQPVVVNCPGEVCEGWAAQAVGWSMALAAAVTRIDVAVDLGPAEVARRRLVEMVRAWKRGQVKTAMARTSHDLHKSDAVDGGWTAYFGGKQSAMRLRAYDRRGPLRLEWQFRPERDVGVLIPEVVSRHGVAAVWRACAQSTVFPMVWYRELLEGPTADWKPAVEEASELAEVLESIREQMGVTLWGLKLLGLSLDDLAVEPEKPRGRVFVKMTRWTEQAAAMGYDGEALKRELRCKLKSRRVRV